MQNRESWIAAHCFLQPIADLERIVDRTIDETQISKATTPTWSDYLNDFKDGVPALHSANVSADLHLASQSIASIVRSLALNDQLPKPIAVQMQRLNAELDHDSDWQRRVVAWLLSQESLPTSDPGLLRYVGWSVLRRYLSGVVESFALWDDELLWLRGYCPICGAVPALAQLTGGEPARIRVLVCGCCTSRWRFRRRACAFCGNADDRQLSILDVEPPNPLRIDHCKICNGYMKTYTAEGEEAVFLADWTSLHIDIIARDCGFQRYASSLYQL